MEKFYVNDLIQIVDVDDSDNGIIKRILWIEDSYNYCFIMNISSQNALPEIELLNKLHIAMENKKLVKVINDPFLKDIKEIDKENAARMHRAVDVINLIAKQNNEPDIYYENTRSKLIKKAMELLNISKPAIYKYLRRYWQGGKREIALLPHYDICGMKGKEKNISSTKRGRPNKNEHIQGINVDKNIQIIFEKSLKSWYNTPKQIKLSIVYKLMLESYFSVNGNLFSKGSYPTIDQFYYWHNKLKDEVRERKTRFGDKYYNLNNRPLLSNTNSEVAGPGSRFEIDACHCKVYLVSRLNRQHVVGKAVVYLIVDVFSRMITGIYVGIENPSWIAASMALANMVEDKVTFCKRYGIDITEDQWPCKYIPQTILADNGEFKWLMPESLPENLNITIENTSSGRADMKPNVERAFGVVRSHFEFLLDGVIKKKLRDRGEKDERIEATIDVYQFTQIVINIVLFMNNNRWIESYDLNEEMIEDFVKLIPIELWNYGIENSSGKLMSVQEDIFKYNLLPKDTVTIRRDGVRLFKVLYYYFENPQYNDMIIRAGISGSKKIEVGYDKRDMSYISIYNNETRSLERAALLGKSKMFEGMSYDEVKAVIDNYNLERSDYMHEQTQANILLNKKNSKILDEGRMMTKQAMDGYNKKAKVKNMKEHRRTEKENVRNEESFELAKKDDNSTKKIQKPERNLAEEYYSKGDMEKLLNDIMGE